MIVNDLSHRFHDNLTLTRNSKIMLQSNISGVSFKLPELDSKRQANNNTTDLITSGNGRISIPSIIDSTI
jgi:hypothetical protein